MYIVAKIQAGLFTRICNILHPLFFSRSVHTQESRIFDYEVLLAATNENMVKGSEPPVKKEWMKDETNTCLLKNFEEFS